MYVQPTPVRGRVGLSVSVRIGVAVTYDVVPPFGTLVSYVGGKYECEAGYPRPRRHGET